MSKAPSMPLFCGDYLADTKHLTLEQHGAYMIILMVTWRNGGKPIPDDADIISKYLSCSRDRWVNKIRPTLYPFFNLEAGTWRSERLEHEWEFVQKAIAIKRENGAKGGRPAGFSKKPDEESQNQRQSGQKQISESQTDNSLKNNETGKATGFSTVNLSETTQPQPYTETSKKESPPTPHSGGEHDPFDILDTDQEGVTGSKSERKTRKPAKSPYSKAERAQAWLVFQNTYPQDGEDPTWATAEKAFDRIVKAGTEPQSLINAAVEYAQSVQGREKKYVKLVGNWFRLGCWKRTGNVHPFPTQINEPEWKTNPRAYSDIQHAPPWPDAPTGTRCGRWYKASQQWVRIGG